MSDYDNGKTSISGTPDVNVVSSVLPTGAATETTLIGIKDKTDQLAVSNYGEAAINFLSTSEHTDLFGKVRVSTPSSLFTSQFLYDKQPLLWDELLAGSGTSTFNSSTSSISLTVTTANGDRVVRQSKEYFSYEPGRAEQIAFTLVFGTGTINCTQKVGLFDDNDGIFIYLTGSTFGIGIRTSTSGSPIDTIVNQSNFNLDKLDGTGKSGITLDISKAQLFFIEYQWFGVGTIRFGLHNNGHTVYFHQVFHANISSSVYMKRGSLPVRYEIKNIGTTANVVTLSQICCCVQSEAGYQPTGIKRSIDTGTTARVVAGTGSIPLLSLRLKSAYNRATLIPENFSLLLAAADNCRYQIILNGVLTGASFTSVDATSIAEFDTAATALSGGTILSSGYLSSVGRSTVNTSIQSLLKVVSNIAGTSDILTLYVSNITSGVNYFGSLEWQEFE